jgi:hypothetical protein
LRRFLAGGVFGIGGQLHGREGALFAEGREFIGWLVEEVGAFGDAGGESFRVHDGHHAN